MNFRHLLVGLSLASTSAAFAAPAADAPTTPNMPNNQTLTDLKAKCSDFVNNPQMKTVKVQITCSELSYFWKALPNKDAVLPAQRTVGVAVDLKGSHLTPGMYPIKAEGTKISCQQFVKTERRIGNIDTELTCQQIADVKDLGDYCAPLLVARASSDPGIVKESATSEKLSFCPEAPVPPTHMVDGDEGQPEAN